MAKLTSHQRQFLHSQGIPLSRVFDATGLTRSAYERQMGELEMIVAIGVSPCRKAGHTLRTRAGHCAQCNTHSLAFLQRFYDDGEIYIVISRTIPFIKIGSSKNVENRVKTLNSLGYGGAADWTLHFSQSSSKAGEVEFRAHHSLRQHQRFRTYIKQGHPVTCQELFDCDAETALEALRAAIELVHPRTP
jgi:hypothetical protein